MKRKLASIQRIESVEPIKGADFIEKIKVLGWNLVAKKGDFHKHDKCIYFEVDSILPDEDVFSFLKTKEDKPIRLRTKKMKKVISQGLAMPIDLLSQFTDAKEISKLSLGDDVSELIGVKKYEAPVNGKSASKGYWPFYLPKTDEIRVQSMPEALEELQGLDCYVSVKLDGCSCTYSYKDGEFEVCSRNWALKDMRDNPNFKDDRWWTMAGRLGIEDTLAKTSLKHGNYAVQGELVGPGIQGNKLGLDQMAFFAFNVYNIDETRYLNFKEFVDFCQFRNIKTVPIELQAVCNFTQEDLLSMAEGKYTGTMTEREGIVIRPVVETYSEALGGRLSLKAISNKFLLKGGD